MKGGRNTKERTDRRPSYPSDQWVKKIHATTKVWVKVAMAIAYLMSVSVVALGLAVYYVFFWAPAPGLTKPTNNSTVPGEIGKETVK